MLQCPICGGDVVQQEEIRKGENWKVVMWCVDCDWKDSVESEDTK